MQNMIHLLVLLSSATLFAMPVAHHLASNELPIVDVKEGLQFNDLPPVLEGPWHATVGLFLRGDDGNYGHGSGVIVAIADAGPAQKKITILTAYHNLTGGEESFGADYAKRYSIVANTRIRVGDDTMTAESYEQIAIGIKIERTFKGLDLALVSVTAPTAAVQQLGLQKVSGGSCAHVDNSHIYDIGFPSVFHRDNAEPLSPLPDLITKRWADGIYIGDGKKKDDETAPEVFTTLDSLSGNSGGPAFDERGKLIGIVLTNWGDKWFITSTASCATVHKILQGL